MAAERDFELLDDYLTNRLNAEDKAYLEQRLNQDPDLQREYSVQQNIAEALRSARKAELKAMLNSVPVPTGGGSTLLTKVVSVGTVALIVGIGAYLFNREDDAGVDTGTVAPVATPDKTLTPKSEANENPNAAVSQDNEVTATPTGESKVKPSPSSTPANPEPRRQPSAYNPAELEEGGENTEENESRTGDVELPDSGSGVTNTETQTEITSKIISDSKHTFHFQRTGTEVTLYGTFDKNLFTIMDFNDVNNGRRSVFLYYKNNYYLLNEDSTIKPLSPVNDPVLLKKLRESR